MLVMVRAADAGVAAANASAPVKAVAAFFMSVSIGNRQDFAVTLECGCSLRY
jgi:hypothetical protein